MGDVLCFPGTVPAQPGDRLVCVPGQKFWHTHICEVCGSSWTHIAPTPMTESLNEKIHTCTKCGTRVYKFVRSEEIRTGVPYGWLAGGALAGLFLAALLDRR
jgi:hypothetical protein